MLSTDLVNILVVIEAVVAGHGKHSADIDTVREQVAQARAKEIISAVGDFHGAFPANAGDNGKETGIHRTLSARPEGATTRENTYAQAGLGQAVPNAVG